MDVMQEDLERNLIASAMQSPTDIDEFIALPVEAWTIEAFGKIHVAIRDLYLEGIGTDIVSLYERMQKSGFPIKIDDLAQLQESYILLNSNFKNLCRLFKSAYDQRVVVSAIEEAGDLAKAAANATEAKQTAIGRLLDLDDYGPKECVVSGMDSLRKVIEDARVAFERPPEEKKKPQGVTTGFRSLDSILGGFRQGDLYILGAGTGRGKSVCGINIASFAASRGSRVLYCTLEMNHDVITRRILTSYSRISSDLIETGELTEDQLGRLTHAASEVKQACSNLTIVYQRGLTLYQLGAIVRQVAKSSGIDLVIVDYLQLLRTDATYSREREVAQISSSLVTIAGINNVPILALSQLNETGQIRESRAIGHDAAGVLRIDYDPEVDQNWDKNTDDVPATIRVLKHRHGRCGSVDLMFSRSHQIFTEYVSSDRMY